MICLKNRTFAVSQTATICRNFCIISCDLLEKSYFCSITNSACSAGTGQGVVVICLKNRTFAVSQTALIVHCTATRGCDLLEKSYFCSITNSITRRMKAKAAVVICLKNRTFAVSQTAFTSCGNKTCCCDLLEKSYFCSITNSWIIHILNTTDVVICLKNRTFAVSQTA